MSALWARNSCGWSCEMLESRSSARSSSDGGEAVGRHVQVVGVLVVEARGHVLPVVAQRGSQLLLRGHRDQRVLRHQVEQLAEAVHGKHVGHVGALGLVARGGDLGELALLRRQLRGRRDLHPLGLLQRALREGREPGEPLHLHVEELAADGALLGGRVDVEDVSSQGELPAVLDLVHALVAAGHELFGRLLQVEQAALLDLEAVRAQLGVGHLLGQRHGRRDEHRRLVPEQRVERRDAQPHQMRRRCQVGLVADARAPGRSAPGAAPGRRAGRPPGRARRGRPPRPRARAARGRDRSARRAGTAAGWPTRTPAAARCAQRRPAPPPRAPHVRMQEGSGAWACKSAARTPARLAPNDSRRPLGAGARASPWRAPPAREPPRAARGSVRAPTPTRSRDRWTRAGPPPRGCAGSRGRRARRFSDLRPL